MSDLPVDVVQITDPVVRVFLHLSVQVKFSATRGLHLMVPE